MLRRAEEMVKIVHENLRDGNGKIFMSHIIEEDESYGTAKLFNVITVPAGSSIGYHQHVDCYEIYYALSGSATITDDGEVYTLNSGDGMMCKDGHFHGIANTTESDFVMVAAVINTK